MWTRPLSIAHHAYCQWAISALCYKGMHHHRVQILSNRGQTPWSSLVPTWYAQLPMAHPSKLQVPVSSSFYSESWKSGQHIATQLQCTEHACRLFRVWWACLSSSSSNVIWPVVSLCAAVSSNVFQTVFRALLCYPLYRIAIWIHDRKA